MISVRAIEGIHDKIRKPGEYEDKSRSSRWVKRWVTNQSWDMAITFLSLIIVSYLTPFESMVTNDGWFCLCHSLT